MCAWDFEDGDEGAKASDEEQVGQEQEEQGQQESSDRDEAEPDRPDEGEDEQRAAEQPEETEVEAEAAEDAEEIVSMDDVDLDEVAPANLQPGDIVTGLVVTVSEDGVLVDIGGKAEGLVPMYEFLDRSEMPKADEQLEVAVVKLQDEDGMTILSKKRADYERVWNRVMRALETGEVMDAMVTDRVKGGLRVDLGVSGFVPASHVATRDVRNLDRFVGRSLRLRVLEADRRRKKVVLSHRLVVEEERKQRKKETMEQLSEGLVCEGKVRNITDYGAFIDLGGVDGLLHISEMSWGRVDHPSDVCSVGDTLRVVVLDIDRERERISLGRRQILPDPWKQVGREINPGDMVTGRVTRIVRTGAFVELPEYEVEGFLPIGELADRRIETPSEVIEEGQELELKVLKMRPSARRMTLSLVAALHEKERQEYQKYMADQDTPNTTLGEQFGDVLGAVASELKEPGAKEESREGGEEKEERAEEDEIEEGVEGADEEEGVGDASADEAEAGGEAHPEDVQAGDEGIAAAGEAAEETDEPSAAGDEDDGAEAESSDDEDESETPEGEDSEE